MSRKPIYAELSRIAFGSRKPWNNTPEAVSCDLHGHHSKDFRPKELSDKRLRKTLCEGATVEICDGCRLCGYGEEAVLRTREGRTIFRAVG